MVNRSYETIPIFRKELGSVYSSPDSEYLEEYKSWIGYTILSAFALALGNSSPSVSLLVYVHFVLLYIAYGKITFTSLLHRAFCSVVSSAFCAAGFSFAFHSVYLQDTLLSSYVYSFLLGFLFYFLIVFGALSAHSRFAWRFPSSRLRYFVFPTIYCCVSLVFTIFVGSYSSVAYAVSDFASLRSAAAFGGLAIIEFSVVFVSALLGTMIMKYDTQTSNVFMFTLLILLVTCVLLNLNLNSIQQYGYSSLPVACITAHQVPYHSHEFGLLRSITSSQALHNDLLLWSEAAVVISAQDESLLIVDMQQLAADTRTYIGFTYLQQQFSGVQLNRFALVSASGQLLWKYTKAFAAPFEQIHTSTTGAKTTDSPYGTLSGAIGKDFDYTLYMRSQVPVDIMLQTGHDRMPFGSRYFDISAMRGVENGFTLFRCASDGFSGVVAQDGSVISRVSSGHEPNRVLHFSLPLLLHRSTVYKSFGWLFEYALNVLSVVLLVLLVMPKGWIIRIAQITHVFPEQVEW